MSLYQPLDPLRHLMPAATADPETPPHYWSAYNIAVRAIRVHAVHFGYQPNPVIGQFQRWWHMAGKPDRRTLAFARAVVASLRACGCVRPTLLVPGLGSTIPALPSHHAIGSCHRPTFEPPCILLPHLPAEPRRIGKPSGRLEWSRRHLPLARCAKPHQNRAYAR